MLLGSATRHSPVPDLASQLSIDLYMASDGKKDIRRGQIKSEGDRIFGLLSANIHDCEVLYDTDHCHDLIRRHLLNALKPLDKNR